MFAITVDPVTLAVGRETYVHATGALLLPAMITPEGLGLERPGIANDVVLPFTQVGEPPVTYGTPNATNFEALFQ